MGAQESVPIPQPPPGFQYLVISLSGVDRIRVLFGTQRELAIIRQAILQHWSNGLQLEKVKCAKSVSFQLNGYPFRKGTNAVQSASIKHMMCQILQQLNNSGWELITTSDLSRIGDLSTFFFVNKSEQLVKHMQFPLLCVSVSSTDKLQIVNAPANIIGVIKNVIQVSWQQGIQEEGPKENCYEFKFVGFPWLSTGDQSVQARILLNNLMTTLAQHQYIIHGAANIKSTADSLFFQYDPTVSSQQSATHFVISLNRTDRLQMISAPEGIRQVVRQIIGQYWITRGGIQKEREYNGSWEFKLTGTPWWSTGEESVMSRFLICKILEGLQSSGWHIRSAIDICRRVQDKSVLVFYPSQQLNAPVMCLSFNDTDKIRLINAPEELVGVLKSIIQSYWYKGIQQERRLPTPCMAHEFKFMGNPWAGYYCVVDGLHMRSLLCYFLQALSLRGWRLLTSADVSAKYVHQKDGPDYSIDVHSWWFTYDTAVVQPIAAAYGFTPTQYLPSVNTATQMGQYSTSSYNPGSVLGNAPPSYEEVLRGGQALQ